ncbi:MAG: hypothetical protein ACRD2O_13955 [Terriglobia bacterium]
MKKYLMGIVLLAAFLTPLWATTPRFQDDSPSVKQDMKDAGRSTKRAAKKTAHKVKKTTKKGVHKSAKTVRKGAKKVEKKTQTTPDQP